MECWRWSEVEKLHPWVGSKPHYLHQFLRSCSPSDWRGDILKCYGIVHIKSQALFMVLGSRHTLNFLFGFLTSMRLWHQSDASLMSSFLMMPRLFIQSISCFKGSTITWGIFLGAWITGVIVSSTSSFTTASFIVPIPSKMSGNSSIIWALQSGLSLVSVLTGGGGWSILWFGMLNPFGNLLMTSIATFLQTHWLSQLTVIRLNALQKLRPNRIFVSFRSVT